MPRCLLGLRLGSVHKYDRIMSSSHEARTPTVRMFPDYADTVLWFTEPIDYGAAKLSGHLTRDLTRWEQSYYEGLNEDYEWKTASLSHRFAIEGAQLAQRVADELGDEFEIELVTFADGIPERRFQGQAGALNSRAAAAFRVLALELSEFEDAVTQAQAAIRRGENTGWFAYAPLSGTVFDPQLPDN